MAKGDNAGGIGIGYNPGGPNIGGSASFGSRPPMQQMNPGQGGIGPSYSDRLMQTNPQMPPPSGNQNAIPPYQGEMRGGMPQPPVPFGYDPNYMDKYRAWKALPLDPGSREDPEYGPGTANPNPPVGMGSMPGGYRPQPMPDRAQGPMLPGNGGGNIYRPQPMPNRAQGPMIGPGFNPMEAIMRMNRMRSQGTSTTTPIQPNSYALNPSANLFSDRRQ